MVNAFLLNFVYSSQGSQWLEWHFGNKELFRGNLKLATKKRLLDYCGFLVLKYGCESWTLNKTLIKRTDTFEQWGYRRIPKISWKDRLSNEQVLHRMGEEKLHFRKNIEKQKLAYAGHVLWDSSGFNA